MKRKDFNTGKTCPVCGLFLDFDPWIEGHSSQEICPCCGVQFGYFDAADSPEEVIQRWCDLREKWIQGGMKWGWSFKHNKAFDFHETPANWNPIEQLKNIPAEFLG